MNRKTFSVTIKPNPSWLHLLVLLLAASPAVAQPLVNNQGAVISVLPNAVVIVKTGSVDNVQGLITNNGRVIVEGDLINNDTILGGNAASRFEVQDDWVNNALFTADSSTVELYGASQNITGTSVTEFHVLQLTGTGIKTQTLDAITNSRLELNDRELATDTNTMFFTNVDPVAITRTTGFVSSLGNGRLSRDMSGTNPYLFPVGSSLGTTRYRPVELTATNPAAQTMEVRMANVDATTEGFDRAVRDPALCQVNPLYYHLIDRASGAANAHNVRFFYDPADGNWSQVAHWQNQPRWEEIGPASQGTAGPFNTLAISGYNVFTPEAFAFAVPEVSLDSLASLLTDATCYGDSTGAIDITLATGTGPISYNWSNGSVSEDLTGIPAGTYTLIVTDANGCNNNAQPYSFTIDEPADITLTASVTDLLCYGASTGAIDLTVTDAVTPLSGIQWSNTQSTEDISGLTAGSYSVQVTDGNGCKQTATYDVVSPDSLSVTTDINNLTCYADGTGDIILNVTGGTIGSPFSYTFHWNTDDSTQNLTDIGAGTYAVTITDGNNCTTEFTGLNVTQPDTLTLVASADDTILLGYPTDIEVVSTSGGTGSILFEWTPADGLTDPFSSFTSANPTETTSYVVVGTDDNGCMAWDTVNLVVNQNAFIVPDGFTPNGDGLNDRFEVITSGAVSVGELRLYNRWGQLISSDPSGWDGKYQGKRQPMDTYVYQLVIIYPDGEKRYFSGDFILIR